MSDTTSSALVSLHITPEQRAAATRFVMREPDGPTIARMLGLKEQT
ncbi:hypothetical protein [Luteipulveratus mongoliensis]|nr:hypothetical protein [Luteipulveratus mongoliensis]